VCLAHKQFSCWRSGGGIKNFGRLTSNADAIRAGQRPPAMARAYDLAGKLLGGSLGYDVTLGADHYYAPISMNPPSTPPYWANGLTPSAIVGRHIFYRMRAPKGTTT
jgi:hypothetical protein